MFSQQTKIVIIVILGSFTNGDMNRLKEFGTNLKIELERIRGFVSSYYT